MKHAVNRMILNTKSREYASKRNTEVVNVMSENSKLSQVVIEALKTRAQSKGDEFDVSNDKATVRCFEPDRHQNGDANPSAEYTIGKYLICHVCGLKLGEKRLAQILGVGTVSRGLTLKELAEAKVISEDYLAEWGWRTQSAKDGQAAVYIPWYDMEGVQCTALAYHLRHYIYKDDGTGPRFTWDKPKHVKLIPYGVWRNREWLEESRTRGVESNIILCESELDAVTFWFHGVPANAYGGANFWRQEWAEFYEDFDHVFVCQEPDPAGVQSSRRVALDLERKDAL